MLKKLPLSFYRQKDVVSIAKQLIGQYFYSRIGGVLTGGIIAETEAYAGITDRASHAYGGKRTPRTQTMYLAGGVSYVYFSYGMHHLFNIVTGAEEVPDAVLIRGIIPVEGFETQKQRRGIPQSRKSLTNGPAKVCQALGITRKHNAILLTGDLLWLAGSGLKVSEDAIEITTRVGVNYAGEDALRPYRFIYKSPDYHSAVPVRR
jgi:DNA-3-methyladenine glycosylase